MKKFLKQVKKKHFFRAFRVVFWFSVGAFLGLFLITNLGFFVFQRIYYDKIYPGIIINGVNFGGKTTLDIEAYFEKKNSFTENTSLVFTSDYGIATVSAKAIDFGYNGTLLASQAYTLGRSKNTLSNVGLIFQSYLNGIYLSNSYTYSEDKLRKILEPISAIIDKEPKDALFKFESGRVTTFSPSENGQVLDFEELNRIVSSKTISIISSEKPKTIVIQIPIMTIEPEISTDKVNNLGIKEQIGSGTSLFQHSIPGRIFNVTLAAARMNGVLIAPGETFSFNKVLGDVSSFTGYKQAYVIKDGRTVLGDGGGVCQVSTTLFRAILDSGMPILERHAHAYRVEYYEQDSPPGIDATVYSPSPDLKFKNDSENYILIQSFVDPNVLRLTFVLYGTKDGREVIMTKPVVTNQTPPPPPLYQDDPTLPKGVVKQVDFSAWGARVYFTRTVTKNGKEIIADKFISNFRAWQSVYLKGTKE
ncbi:MAG: VanW family protein [Candidatus Levyibacteriota bacterium]